MILHHHPAPPGEQMTADDVAVIDPRQTGRLGRQTLIRQRLPRLPFPNQDETLLNNLTTGHCIFQILREFFRRLRRATFRDEVLNCPDYIWDPYEEFYDHDATRKLMAAHCCNRAIELSHYHGRMSMELPGLRTPHDTAMVHLAETLHPGDGGGNLGRGVLPYITDIGRFEEDRGGDVIEEERRWWWRKRR